MHHDVANMVSVENDAVVGDARLLRALWLPFFSLESDSGNRTGQHPLNDRIQPTRKRPYWKPRMNLGAH